MKRAMVALMPSVLLSCQGSALSDPGYAAGHAAAKFWQWKCAAACLETVSSAGPRHRSAHVAECWMRC